jgi:hypothetical protein
MTTRQYYQSCDIDGYRAKVTIEWEMPADIDPAGLPGWERAETLADMVLAYAGPRMRDVVRLMRGETVPL